MMDDAKFQRAVAWVRETWHLPMLERLHARDRAVRSARQIQDGSLDIDDAPPEAASLYAQWKAREVGDFPLATYLRRNLPQPKPRGRPDLTGRNRAFILAIRNVKEACSLPATRSRSDGPRGCCARGGSAADVVGAALPGKIKGGRPVFLTYSRIARIWGDRRKSAE